MKFNTYAQTDKFGFETKTCSRCNGSGSYSYNLLDGDRCYGCGGTGKKYTKRGEAARVRFMDLRKVAIRDLNPGDRVYADIYKWATIESVEIYTDSQGKERTNIQTSKGGLGGLSPDHKLTLAGLQDAAQVAALEYQNTLTKTGKPRRR